ncbi:unnamed protein product, partial [Heligmosomoides polygyrus]|uniref:ACB domain-containing protein n=1 Tax=Heligmosomoides polygyrus TaxID=6339 RepID=A0A183GNS8_HELPZ
IQERGFRTRRAGSLGVGGISSKTEQTQTRWNVLADMFGATKKAKDDNIDGWTQYDSELKKLPETQQKTYTEGFVKGLLASKTSNSAAPKKSSTLTRFYIFLAACVLLGYLSGGWFCLSKSLA